MREHDEDKLADRLGRIIILPGFFYAYQTPLKTPSIGGINRVFP